MCLPPLRLYLPPSKSNVNPKHASSLHETHGYAIIFQGTKTFSREFEPRIVLRLWELCSCNLLPVTKTILTGTQTLVSFPRVDLCLWNIQVETSKFCLTYLFFCSLFPSYRYHPRRWSNPGQFFSGCGLSFCIIVTETRNLLFELFLYWV